jgi:hypothetical protein
MRTDRKHRNSHEDQDGIRRFDYSDLYVYFMNSGPLWGCMPLLLGLFAAWYFGRMQLG